VRGGIQVQASRGQCGSRLSRDRGIMVKSVIRTGVSYLVCVAGGAVAGVVLWVVSVGVLLGAGLSFYAPSSALPVALIGILVAAPLLYRASMRRCPRHRGHVLAFLIAGTAFLLYGTVAIAITAPHTIVFLS
jgi:hypothetical protein